jgi:hypothetical protein
MKKRRFHSYGPVDSRQHFAVPRRKLVETCAENLIGDPEEDGHYFTVWAPRQTGKTWLMREAKKEIESRYPERFSVRMMSAQGIVLEKDDPPEAFLSRIPLLFDRFFGANVKKPDSWEELGSLFSKKSRLAEKPLILFIDEFDKLPPGVIDRMVGMFRDIYLDRENFCLHGLALVGVRAVLGVESETGSPFNIQRSLHVPNLTKEEVEDMFDQYREESGQAVESEVVNSVYTFTRGQPGLAGWFGELLTEKYNPGPDAPICTDTWNRVCHRALNLEWNNTVLNLLKKARGRYREHVLEIFGKPDIPFALDAEWCGYLYLNGIIDEKTETDASGREASVCIFSSPFIQQRLYNALTPDIVGDRMPILALDPLDDLADVLEGSGLNVPALLDRYKAYLKRLKAKGLNPWKDQPRRSDLHLTEYVGHFHLYAWLKDAVGDLCSVSPEFPTGNGRVDLHLRCGEKRGIIEVKSHKSMSKTRTARKQAARYAKQLGMLTVTLAVFVPADDETVLEKLSGETDIDGVNVFVSAIGWV